MYYYYEFNFWFARLWCTRITCLWFPRFARGRYRYHAHRLPKPQYYGDFILRRRRDFKPTNYITASCILVLQLVVYSFPVGS